MKYVAFVGKDAKKAYKDLENFLCAGTIDEKVI
jgi:hypothetical protein